MSKEEIIEAFYDNKIMPFIQPDQLANIVDFVIKNFKPSLPSNLDEAAEEIASDIAPTHPDIGWNECFEKIKEGIKAGAELMAGQGVSMLGKVGIYGVDVESITKELREAGFNLGEEIVLQVRKKQ